MTDIQVIKLKVRRGTNSQRRLVILDQGELGYTIDTNRLFIGTGTLSGGLPAAPKIHESIITDFPTNSAALNPEIGDVVYAENKLYRLNSSGAWEFIGTQTDGGPIAYDNDNQLSITSNSINGTFLNQQLLSSDSVTFNTNDEIVVNYETTQFTISSTSAGNKFSLNSNAIKPIHIDSSIVSRGLAGGAGQALSAYVDNTTIGYNSSNQLQVIGTPISAVAFSNLLCGFQIDAAAGNKVSTLVAGVDPSYFGLSGGIITFNGGILSAAPYELASFSLDNGLIRDIKSSIYDILSCDDSDAPYNGSPDQVRTGYSPTYTQTTINAISASSTGTPTTISLESGGFIIFQGDTGPGSGLSARNGSGRIPGRFAIPVFTF